jgi:hypothetical protein
VIDALAVLSTHEPDPIRADRVRARCHAALQRERGRRRRVPPLSSTGRLRRFEPAIVGCLCAVYLVEVLVRAMKLYSF